MKNVTFRGDAIVPRIIFLTYVIAHGFCGLTTVTIRSNEFARFRWLSSGYAVAETGSHANVVVDCYRFIARRGYNLLDGGRLTPGVSLWIQHDVVHLQTMQRNTFRLRGQADKKGF